MELKDIYGLWDRFDASGATELELDYHGVHFHLKNEKQSGSILEHDPMKVPERKQAKVKAPVTETGNDTAEKNAGLKNIKAPLVGIFYCASAPGAEPFVKPGQMVKKGDVVGIIEAMKCMNEITAMEDGFVEEVLAEDASMVEYDQVLITFRTAGEGHV